MYDPTGQPWSAGGPKKAQLPQVCTGVYYFPMPYFEFLWTNENTAHIAEHGVSQADFEAVVLHSVNRGISRRSLLPVAWGYTTDGRYIMAVYDAIDDVTVYPVTAYEVPEPR